MFMLGSQIAFVVSSSMVVSSFVLHNYSQNSNGNEYVKLAENDYSWAVISAALLGPIGVMVFLASVSIMVVSSTLKRT